MVMGLITMPIQMMTTMEFWMVMMPSHSMPLRVLIPMVMALVIMPIQTTMAMEFWMVMIHIH